MGGMYGEIRQLNLTKRKNKKTTWTTDSIIECARVYETRSEFKTRNPAAYSAARRHGVLDIACKHMDVKLTTWTDDLLHQEALKYATRKEFQTSSPSAWVISRNRNLLNSICSHMELKWEKKHTDESVASLAKVCSSKSEFKKRHGGAYQYAIKNGIYNDVTAHMKPPNKYHGKRLIYFFDVAVGPHCHGYIGLAKIVYNTSGSADFKKTIRSRYTGHKELRKRCFIMENIFPKIVNWDDPAISHKSNGRSGHVHVDIKEAEMLEEIMIKHYSSTYILHNISKNPVIYSRDQIIESLNYAVFLGNTNWNEILEEWIHSSMFIWAKDAVIDLSMGYKTRKEFIAENSGAYSAACKNKWLELLNPTW